MLNKLSPNFFKYLTLGSFSLGSFNAITQYNQRISLQAKYDTMTKDYMDLQNRIKNLSDASYEEFTTLNTELANLKSKMDAAAYSMDKARESGKILSNTDLSSEDINKYKDTLIDNINNAHSNFESIKAWINSKGGFNVMPNITDYINKLSDLLNSDNLIQLTATVNLLGSLFIFFSMISIIGIFYGNKIIDTFKIVEKYPRLKSYLDLRFKLQQYYLLTDIFFIMCVLFTMAYINILMYSTYT